jgi:hypothetical protein
LWLIDRQHLYVFVLFDRLLELSSLSGIKSDDGQILWCKVHGIWAVVNLLEPEGQKLLNRFALRVVVVRGPIKTLLPVNVDKDERIFKVEEAFFRGWHIAGLDLVLIERFVRNLDQSLVHSVLDS